MIITCEKCSTKFNLDESVLKKDGSKVRCSMCKHIFKAYPPNNVLIDVEEKLSSKPITTSPESEDIIQKDNNALNIDSDLKLENELKIDDYDLKIDNNLRLESELKIDDYDLKIDDEFTIDDDLVIDKQAASNLKIENDNKGYSEQEDELDLDFSLDDDMDFSAPQQQPSSPPPKPKIVPQPVDTDSGLELDLDFSLDDDMELSTPQQQPSSPPPKPKIVPQPVDTDSGLELDLNFSLDDDMELSTPQQQPSSTPPKPKPASQPVDTDNGIELDMDFSLDDDMDFSAPQQQPSSPPPKPASRPVDTDNGIELDMDFSLDDDMDFSAPQQQPTAPPPKPKPVTQPVDTDNGIELDIDFSFDDDIDFSQAPSKSSPQKTATPVVEKRTHQNDSSIDFNDNLSLDMDFSLDSDVNNASTSSQHKISQPSKKSANSLKMENELELSMDFSNIDEELSMDNSTDSDEGLEIQMEDDSEFDFDFSSSERDPIQSKTNTISKAETNPKNESISPIEMEFSTDDEIESDEEDVFDEEYYDASEDQIKELPSNSQQQKNKISLTKSQSQETTLGGQPIIGGSGQGSTLLGNRPNLFEDSILFDKHKSSTFGIKKIIIIPIILIILLIAGFAASLMMGVKTSYLSGITPYIEKIPYINKILSPKPEPIKLTPDQKSVSGKFITNTISGTLFVITGQVNNQSKTPCKDIKIEGTLIATNKVKVKNKTVLCGNVIPEEQLKTLDMNSINSILYSSDGNKKFTVDPGKSIPFMVVFSDFPDNLENFTVVVTDFKKVDNKQ